MGYTNSPKVQLHFGQRYFSSSCFSILMPQRGQNHLPLV